MLKFFKVCNKYINIATCNGREITNTWDMYLNKTKFLNYPKSVLSTLSENIKIKKLAKRNKQNIKKSQCKFH